MSAVAESWIPVCDSCGHRRWERCATPEQAEEFARRCDCTAVTCTGCATTAEGRTLQRWNEYTCKWEGVPGHE